MLGIICKLTIKPGANDEFERLIQLFKKEVDENEPGNLMYEIFRGETPEEYIIMEKFKDKVALAAHNDTPHKHTISPQVGQLLNAKPEVKVMPSL